MISGQGTGSWLSISVRTLLTTQGEMFYTQQLALLRGASGRLIKLLIFELLEFAAFATPTLVMMEQFASAYQKKAGSPGKTHYWLIVSCSIAYVASVTLLIWVPVKVLLYKKHRLYAKIKGW